MDKKEIGLELAYDSNLIFMNGGDICGMMEEVPLLDARWRRARSWVRGM